MRIKTGASLDTNEILITSEFFLVGKKTFLYFQTNVFYDISNTI